MAYNLRIIVTPEGNGTKCMNSLEIDKKCCYRFFNILDMDKGYSLPNMDFSDIKFIIERHYRILLPSFNSNDLFSFLKKILSLEEDLSSRDNEKLIYILPKDKDLFYDLLINNGILKFEYNKKKTILNNIQLIYV